MEVLLFLKNVAIGFAALYLAFTNVLASGIEALLPDEEPRTETTTSVTETRNETAPGTTADELTEIPSDYVKGGPIPRILIENSNYQRASAVEGAAASRGTAARIEDALVNILCQYDTGEAVRTTAGTGFFIHENGAILTNAHVAQFLLLEEAPDIEETACVIRTGNPATATYTADLLYFPPTWITKNASLIRDERPQGTGERDFALLYVKDTLDNSPRPARFPTLSFDTALLPHAASGTTVTLGGYPADRLFDEGPQVELSPEVATTTLTALFTFGTGYADLMAVAPSAVGEQGTSGGPILDANGNVIGLITTKGNVMEEGGRSLRAITLSYVNRTITEETGFSLAHTLSGDLAYRGRIFKQALAPFLSQILAREVN